MKTRTTRLIAACISVLALAASAQAGPLTTSTQPGDPLDPRTYAPESTPFLTVNASGVQKYACQANGTWLFTDPVADLYKRKAIGTHYLNFASGRPIWEHKDGSMVEAARKASAPAGAGNIPALLLEAVATTAGAEGDRLAKTTWVQRLNTSGGVAPAGTCAPGATVAVPYTTDYVFWKAKGGQDADD